MLRLVTWNIHGCAAGIDEVINQLRKLDADVICLQEVEVGTENAKGLNQAQHIAERLKMDYFSAGSQFATGGEQRMAILAKVKLVETSALDAGTGRIYGVAAGIECRGAPLQIASVHLTSTHRVEADHVIRTARARMQEAADLAQQVRARSSEIIIAGDFNSVPGLSEHKPLREILKRIPSTQPTYPSNKPRAQIDHIYHSAGLRVENCVVPDSSASDHRPVVVGFSSITQPAGR